MHRSRPLVALLPFALAAVQVCGLVGEAHAAPQNPALAPAPVGGSAPTVAAPEPEPPLAKGPPPDLDLVFTAQVIGWIEPCG